MQKSKQMLADHLKKHPLCTKESCPHTLNFVGIVIFKQPDNGFLATIQAFDKEGALQVFKEGVAKSHPHLDVKRIEVDYA